MAGTLVFSDWQRGGIYELVQRGEALVESDGIGRLIGRVELTLTERETGDSESDEVEFLIAGPGDVSGLNAGTIRKRYPVKNALDVETTKCPYVELSAQDLPWRHSPELHQAANARVLRPWLVLIVGTEEEITLVGEDQVTLSMSVQADLPLADSARWAHLQTSLNIAIDHETDLPAPPEDWKALTGWEGPDPDTAGIWKALAEAKGGRAVARILCPREMPAKSRMIAALVPAFAADGSVRRLSVATRHRSQFQRLRRAFSIDLPQDNRRPRKTQFCGL